MNDAQLERLLAAMDGAPHLTAGRWRFTYVAGRVVVQARVGKGERWSFAPSRDVVQVERFLERSYHGRAVNRWVELAGRLDFARHAAAMAARVL